jgi:hypothetical protein
VGQSLPLCCQCQALSNPHVVLHLQQHGCVSDEIRQRDVLSVCLAAVATTKLCNTKAWHVHSKNKALLQTAAISCDKTADARLSLNKAEGSPVKAVRCSLSL